MQSSDFFNILKCNPSAFFISAKEEDLFIRYMLALEEAREDWEKGQAKLLELISDAESAGLEDMNISDDENSTQIEVSVPTIDKSIYSIHDRPDLTSPWNTPNVPKNGKRSSDSSTTSITPTVPSYTGQNSLRPSVSALNVSYLRGTNFPMQYRPNVTNPSYRARMTYSQMRSFNPNIRGMITSQVTPIKSTSTMPLQSTPSQITYSSTPILYKGSDEASVSSTGASGTVTSPTPTITTSYTFSSATTAGTDSVTFTVPASASTEATTTTVTATTTETKQKYSLEDFPVSKDGICPYCKSSDVLYIILMHENSKDDDLPPILKGLLQQGKAYKMPKGLFPHISESVYSKPIVIFLSSRTVQ